MQIYDWIVIGGGLSGAALSYELAKVGFSVLLLEQEASPHNATRFSYGGISYWSGTTELMRQLGDEGIKIHHTLSAELEGETQFRELDLLLTIDLDLDPQAVADSYKLCAQPPVLISAETACEMEPLLAKSSIAAALHTPHAQVEPEQTVKAYNQAFLRLGGTITIAAVTDLLWQDHRVHGVIASQTSFPAANVVVCAGGISRALLQSIGIAVPLYFTQAELIETAPVDIRLHSLVMPAELKRFQMESDATQAERVALWDQPDQEVVPPILDAGVVQFGDGRLRIGQISRTLSTPTATGDATTSEQQMRQAIAQYLPKLRTVPGTWHSCLVAFGGDRLPLIGALPAVDGLYLFSGFSNPFAVLPPLARHFAAAATGADRPLLHDFAVSRFETSL